MKWIKHMTASWDDERMAKLVDGGGLAMYGLYWRVQEIIAAKMEGPDPSCSACYSISRWSRLLSVRGSDVFSTLSRLSSCGVSDVCRDGSDITVTNRKLLKYRDEYARKSGHSPDNIPPRTEEEVQPTVSLSANGHGHHKQNTPARFSASDIESIYQQYPRKIAKEAALKAIKKALENLEADDPVEALKERVATFAKSRAGQKGEFVPYPASWFNAKQYLDDPKEWER